MTKRLRDNLSSGYFEAANRMTSKRARRRIVAYVESYDDVFFWRTVFSRFEDETRYFEVMLPSRGGLSRGKKPVLMNLLYAHVGRDMIACVDADYDWLLQGATGMSERVVKSPYVFHTYVYSIENFQCYAPSLHDVCVMVTLNDHAIFNFSDYLVAFSRAIFPLFVWNIWYYRQNRYGEFTMSDFNRVIETGNFNLKNPDACIANVRRKAGRMVGELERRNPDAKESYLALKAELKSMGVSPDSTYLYIQGHHLFNKVAVPMLTKVCNYLRQERENEITRNAVHGTQRRNELSSYGHSVSEVPMMLRRNTGYVESTPFLHLLEDVKAFLKIEDRQSDTAKLDTQRERI